MGGNLHFLREVFLGGRRASSKRRGYPDRRGMGAQSDFISEVFVPDDAHRAEQIARARMLVAGGLTPNQVAAMLSLPLEALEAEVPKA